MDNAARGVKDGKIKRKGKEEKDLGESHKHGVQVKGIHCMYKQAPKEANWSNTAESLFKTISQESWEVKEDFNLCIQKTYHVPGKTGLKWSTKTV